MVQGYGYKKASLIQQSVGVFKSNLRIAILRQAPVPITTYSSEKYPEAAIAATYHS
jgi:hypothetical protein